MLAKRFSRQYLQTDAARWRVERKHMQANVRFEARKYFNYDFK